MNIAVIGAGYVGVTTSIAFAEQGHHVFVVDLDKEKLEKLNHSILPFYEDGMEELLMKLVEQQHLIFTDSIQAAVRQSELIFIAVGTPPLPSGAANLEQIEQVSKAVGSALQEYRTIVIKSTVPIGTGEKVEFIIKEELDLRKKDIEFDVVANPEFLREGNALHDALYPDRIVVGCENMRARKMMEKLYQNSIAPILFTNRKEAELVKYASNAFLATKISFINELARVSEQLGINISVVSKGMGMDRRIGADFLRAGIGYGGSCFPKDTRALLAMSSEVGMPLKILEAVVEINETQVDWFMEKIVKSIGSLEGKHIGLLGLTFKPNTDDIREATSLKLIQELLLHKATVSAYDPKSTDIVTKIYPQVRFATCPLDAINNVDASILVTEWDEIIQMDWKEARKRVRQSYLFDGRNVLDPKKMVEYGFCYEGVGIGNLGKENLHG
ncbi:UDP-glucose dehydrogenase family protein [Robertmurraya kyonggiensis]|uniref:UDP-glucose 6-dehydrogenase n=1 Tax=Robertmurraya kyonggiensis TaxID=1037680 RepID=A0A4U1DAN3_9BACI|nr:UDP-glucose/GDP-mannose dehydrogenase family protein [Robertmurraya kyonggiensis]TKC19649.1 UDP-glucose/GDP-mannose dehydrogenase family protein [Robertmurraya kyonggiensis]